MIELEQQSNLAVGSLQDLEALQTKESVKVLLVSDSHGNSRVLQAIISHFGKDCDLLCFCGDGITDLVESLELTFFDSDFNESFPPVVYFVRGNGDNSTSTIFTDKRIPLSVPDFQEFTVANKKIFLTHGHRYGVYYGLKDLKAEAVNRNCNIVLYGHTHVPNSLRCHNKKNCNNELLGILNPGSCAEARGGMPNTFVILDLFNADEKCQCHYYKIAWDRYGDTVFSEIPTPRGEIKLF